MASIYEAEINLNVENAHTRVIRLVGRGKRVLELGCATGYMSRVLRDQFGCTVTGVELNSEAAQRARAFCTEVIEGDLDTLDWGRALGTSRFDVIIAADVLEHIYNPAALLATLRNYLAGDGYLVASIPNIVHLSVLVELLNGRFSYQPFGLLDETHIRFFTRDSIYECFERGGYAVSHLERVTIPPNQTEFRTDLSLLSPEVRELLESREESTTYQFILTAQPLAGGGAGDANRASATEGGQSPATQTGRARLDALIEQLDRGVIEGLMHAINGRMAFLENGRQHQTEVIGSLRAQLLRAEIHIGSMDGEIRRWNDMATRLSGDLESAQAKLVEERRHLGDELERAHAKIEQIEPKGREVDELRRVYEVNARRLVEERRRLGDELERAQRDHDALSQTLTKTQLESGARLGQLRAEYDRQLAQLRVEYEQSNSWRCTAPMRAAFRLLRSLRGTAT